MQSPPQPDQPGPFPASNQAVTVREIGWTITILLIFTIIQAAYAIELNRLFYSQYGPFYDSVAYLSVLAETIHRADADGFYAAFHYAQSSSTVFLPFGLVPFLSPFLPLDRASAVVLQSLWVLLLTGSLAYYFRQCRRAEPLLAVALALLFVSIHAVYFWNGGLSDFRVDLQFYLLYGTAIIWLLIARQLQATWGWIVWGAMCGICCLGRATAPVFFAMTCLPMVLPDLLSGWARCRATLKGLLWGSAVCLLICGWFFVLNWKQLYYYYFIWNTDANARLPLAESVRHFRFASDSAGLIILTSAALCALIALIVRFTAQSEAPRAQSGFSSLRRWLAEVEWRALAPALIPAGYLTLSGSGLNPFVSMPSAFGFILCLVSLAGYWPSQARITRSIILVALLGVGLSATTGISLHRQGPGSNPIAAYAEATRAIQEQAPVCPGSVVNVSHFSLGHYHNTALKSYLIYDRHWAIHRGEVYFQGKKIAVEGALVFAPATKIEWEQLPGTTDEERIQQIADKINRETDLLILPTQQTAELLGLHHSYNYINRFTARIRQRVLSAGKWNRVSNDFNSSPWEQYAVFRNGTR